MATKKLRTPSQDCQLAISSVVRSVSYLYSVEEGEREVYWHTNLLFVFIHSIPLTEIQGILKNKEEMGVLIHF